MKNIKRKNSKRFYARGPSVVESHQRPEVDLLAADAGATPKIGDGVVLAVANRLADEGYEPFAYIRLTQEFVDRLYRLARFAQQENLEYLELEHRINWSFEMYRRRPQYLRIARNHFYWHGSPHHSWAEANTAPVLFGELEEQLALNDTTATRIIFVGIEDPDDRADALAALQPEARSILSSAAPGATDQD
jgi:hypothetical protein